MYKQEKLGTFHKNKTDYDTEMRIYILWYFHDFLSKILAGVDATKVINMRFTSYSQGQIIGLFFAPFGLYIRPLMAFKMAMY